MTQIKGKIILKPIGEVKYGQCVIWQNTLQKVVHIMSNEYVALSDSWDRKTISELFGLVMEYQAVKETIQAGKKLNNENVIKHYPIVAPDWQYILENSLVGKEMEFEKTYIDTYMYEPLYYAKLVKPSKEEEDDEEDVIDYWVAKKKLMDMNKPKQESWDGIFAEGIKLDWKGPSIFQWLKDNFHAPKRK